MGTGAEQLPPSVQATEALRITSTELLQFKVMDDVIPEPLGGAHSDPMGCFPAIKDAIMDIYKNKCALPPAASSSCRTPSALPACQAETLTSWSR